ncbi:MAG: 4-vinyl reductase [Candidatus Methanofastidiosia archaeon]
MSEGRKIDNFSMKVWMETLENIIGKSGLESILNFAHLHTYIDNPVPDNDELEIPAEDFRALIHSMTELFGAKGARVLQIQVGREFVRIGVEKRPGMAKALRVAARLLPENKRMRLALQKWIEGVEQRFPSQLDIPRFELEEDEDYFIFTDRDNVSSGGMTSEHPVYGAFVGVLQALMEWVTGHPHEVEEIKCRAMGDTADVFRISKLRKER